MAKNNKENATPVASEEVLASSDVDQAATTTAADLVEAAAKSKKRYFTSMLAAGMVIKKADGSKVRFEVFFDTFKGDKVRVGYFASDDTEVINRCVDCSLVDEISESEYNKAVSKLNRAPVYTI